MQTQQTKTKAKDRVSCPPEELYVLRCPNPGCGKAHFSVGNSLIEGSHLRPECPSCCQSEQIGQYLVYGSDGKIILRVCCSHCHKEYASLLPGIHRICERCGWEGEFFLGFPKMSAWSGTLQPEYPGLQVFRGLQFGIYNQKEPKLWRLREFRLRSIFYYLNPLFIQPAIFP